MAGSSTADERPVFCFSLGSAGSWIAAERVNAVFDPPPVWQPVLFAEGPPGDRDAVERRAAELGLLPVRWPRPWPSDLSQAMLAATFAKQTGRAVAFALAAFRQAFAAGRDLSQLDNVLIAAAACELHPRAVLKAIESRGVREELDRATADARARGVRSVPALMVGDEVFEGDDQIEEAAARVR